MKKLVLLLGSSVLFFQVFGQQQRPDKCGAPHFINYIDASYPGYKQQVAYAFEDNASQLRSGNVAKSNDEYIIPVVFHIVYNTQRQNLHDSIILSQLDVLNKDFNAQNADVGNLRPIFQPYRGNPKIRFRLATIDPSGNPTTGITRTQTSIQTFSNSNINADFDLFERVKKTATGGKDAWNTQRYLNIWVCDMSFHGMGMEIPFLLGYASPPLGLSNWPQDEMPDLIDGVVLQFQSVGSNNPDGSIDVLGTRMDFYGRTATHEVGHYLGLRHIWGDGDCSAHDGIDDTPNSDEDSGQECDKTKNKCVDNIDGVDLPDLVENFMDYSAEDCMNMFTKGQTNFMRQVLENERYDLVHDNLASISNIPQIDVNVFPNPAKENILLKASTLLEGQLSLTDLSGRTIMSIEMNDSQTTIDVSTLNAGMYIVVYQGKQLTKFVKE